MLEGPGEDDKKKFFKSPSEIEGFLSKMMFLNKLTLENRIFCPGFLTPTFSFLCFLGQFIEVT